MSQAKVDKYKQEKYNRKNANKKTNAKKIVAYVICTLAALAFVVYIGYSIGISTGLIDKPVTTTPVERSAEEIESIRDYLIQQGDANVQNVETTVADTSETTVAEETTAK